VVAAARSLALAQADVILFIGTKLNWMFGYGQPPTFNQKAHFIQIDANADNINHNVHSTLYLCGNVNAVMGQLLKRWKKTTTAHAANRKQSEETTAQWWAMLRAKIEENTRRVESLCEDARVPLGYHYVLNKLKQFLPRDAIIINEGANTMDMCVCCISFFPYLLIDHSL
jgi:2-hydroxyacyl-CoA lyase 1